MAILAFQKPDKVIMLESDDQFGKFEFRPLEPGYGITVGNALRRILLSSAGGLRCGRGAPNRGPAVLENTADMPPGPPLR